MFENCKTNIYRKSAGLRTALARSPVITSIHAGALRAVGSPSRLSLRTGRARAETKNQNRPMIDGSSGQCLPVPLSQRLCAGFCSWGGWLARLHVPQNRPETFKNHKARSD